MCLSIYLGSNHKLELPQTVAENCLGIEVARWKPAPLSKHQFCYYVGQKSGGAELGCSCLLLERVEWTEQGPVAFSDHLFPDDGSCPFAALRGYVELVIRMDSHAVLVCDDSGGVEQNSNIEDYDERLIRPSMINRGNLLFASLSVYPCCVFYVIPDAEMRKPTLA